MTDAVRPRHTWMPVFTGMMTDFQFALRRWISTIPERDIKQLRTRPKLPGGQKNVCSPRRDAILSTQRKNQED